MYLHIGEKRLLPKEIDIPRKFLQPILNQLLLIDIFIPILGNLDIFTDLLHQLREGFDILDKLLAFFLVLEVLEFFDAFFDGLVGGEDLGVGEVGFNFGAEEVLELFHFNYIYKEIGMTAWKVVAFGWIVCQTCE